MNIHEHQGKELLRRYGVAVPDGQACFTVDEAVAAASRLGFPCVVKAQIHAGGRGKAGGVKLVRSVTEVRAAAEALLGKTLVTVQTGGSSGGFSSSRAVRSPASSTSAWWSTGRAGG